MTTYALTLQRVNEDGELGRWVAEFDMKGVEEDRALDAEQISDSVLRMMWDHLRRRLAEAEASGTPE